MRPEIAEGLRLVFHNPALRALAGVEATCAFFDRIVLSILALYVIETLDLPGSAIGLIFSSLGAGLPLGSVSAPWSAHRLGAERHRGVRLGVGVATAEAALTLAAGPARSFTYSASPQRAKMRHWNRGDPRGSRSCRYG